MSGRKRIMICLGCLLVLSVAAFATDTVVKAQATVETKPMPMKGDRADDACFWIHPNNASMSTVIGTNKDDHRGGLHVYDLTGKELHFISCGKINNFYNPSAIVCRTSSTSRIRFGKRQALIEAEGLYDTTSAKHNDRDHIAILANSLSWAKRVLVSRPR